MAQLDDILSPVIGRYSVADIAKVAGISSNHLSDLRRGQYAASHATIAKVRMAVSRLKMRQIEGPAEVAVMYRVVMALAAVATGVDPAHAQASDPARKQTVIESWRRAQAVRWLAQYVMNTTLGFRQVDVARAAGVTKQAINQAVREVEERRDDPAFDAQVVKVERWILGEQG